VVKTTSILAVMEYAPLAERNIEFVFVPGNMLIVYTLDKLKSIFAPETNGRSNPQARKP